MICPQSRPTFTGLFAVGGPDVLHGVGLGAYSGSPIQVTYDIGGHYSELRVGLAIGDKWPYPAHLDILGDDASLLSGGVDITHSGQIISKTPSLAGCNTRVAGGLGHRVEGLGELRGCREPSSSLP